MMWRIKKYIETERVYTIESEEKGVCRIVERVELNTNDQDVSDGHVSERECAHSRFGSKRVCTTGDVQKLIWIDDAENRGV